MKYVYSILLLAIGTTILYLLMLSNDFILNTFYLITATVCFIAAYVAWTYNNSEVVTYAVRETEDEIVVKYDSQQVNRSIRIGDVFSEITDRRRTLREILSVSPLEYCRAEPYQMDDRIHAYFSEKEFLDEELFYYLGNIND